MHDFIPYLRILHKQPQEYIPKLYSTCNLNKPLLILWYYYDVSITHFLGGTYQSIFDPYWPI